MDLQAPPAQLRLALRPPPLGAQLCWSASHMCPVPGGKAQSIQQCLIRLCLKTFHIPEISPGKSASRYSDRQWFIHSCLGEGSIRGRWTIWHSVNPSRRMCSAFLWSPSELLPSLGNALASYSWTLDILTIGEHKNKPLSPHLYKQGHLPLWNTHVSSAFFQLP